jgi:YndJ-like protein
MRTEFRTALMETIAPFTPLSIAGRFSILAIVCWAIKPLPQQPEWAVLMTLFAALWLVPIGFQQVRKRQSLFTTNEIMLLWHLPAVLLLAISFILEKGNIAGVLSVPYAAWNLAILLRGVKINFQLPYLMTLAAWGFLLNASIWLCFDRFDYQPLNFSAWIVLLTGAHFHYAGFALTLVLALFLNKKPQDKMAQIASWAVLMGVVLTATGITLTQLGFTIFIETLAGIVMALAGVLSGFVFIKNSFTETQPTKTLWLIGGSCLVFAMILAFLYASRSFIVLPFLDIPFMQAVHGSVNALGFGTLMLLGWVYKPQ